VIGSRSGRARVDPSEQGDDPAAPWVHQCFIQDHRHEDGEPVSHRQGRWRCREFGEEGEAVPRDKHGNVADDERKAAEGEPGGFRA
jgi:hypothetical protein